MKNLRFGKRMLPSLQRIKLREFCLAGFLMIGASSGLAQQNPVTVEVGQSKHISVRGPEVIRVSVTEFESEYLAARWDSSQNKIQIRGRKASRKELIVKYEGTYRQIVTVGVPRDGDRKGDGKRATNGPTIVERSVPFAGHIRVVVLPQRGAEGEGDVSPIRNASRMTLHENQTRSSQLKVYLHPAFGRANEEGVSWRGVRGASENPQIANFNIGTDAGGWLKLHLIGVSKGQTTVRIWGERRFENSWQLVERVFYVTVNGTKEMPRPKAPAPARSEAITASWGDTPLSLRLRGQNGRVFRVICPPKQDGSNRSIWGDGIYTDDSSICQAAVHAGLITPASGGAVWIEILPGQNGYRGLNRNGITSRAFGSFRGSFTFRGGGHMNR